MKSYEQHALVYQLAFRNCLLMFKNLGSRLLRSQNICTICDIISYLYIQITELLSVYLLLCITAQTENVRKVRKLNSCPAALKKL